MTKYKIVKMGTEWTVNRVDGIELIPVRPIRYYKTKVGALRKIKEMESKGG